MAQADFDAFYDDALPVVFGFLLRACGGDRDQAWDLTQDVWTTFIEHVNRGRDDVVSIGWLLSVARSRHVDAWRRRGRLTGKLRLLWSAEREQAAHDSSSRVLADHIEHLRPDHRLVLTLCYVDDLPIDQVAALMGMSRSSTYALLARARAAAREMSGAFDG
jgi:RNA polymerase sigma factor (sigma-70 family)